MGVLDKLIIKKKFSVIENNINIDVSNMQFIASGKLLSGNFLVLKGEYKFGDEDIIMRWLSYVLIDTLGGDLVNIIDLTKYNYFGGDKFLEFFHILLRIKIDQGYETQEIVDFFPNNIVFLTNVITKNNIFSLIEEDFNEEDIAKLKSLFFEDLELALISLVL